MSSFDDLPMRVERGVGAAIVLWNRRLHYFVGLYLLFFCWLFLFSGLLLNHPRWAFAEFWPRRVQTTMEATVAPSSGSDDDRAREVMRQLAIMGEIQWPPRADDSVLAFQVTRPGMTVDVRVDARSNRATIVKTVLNGWGILRVLHTFTGVRMGDGRNERDWVLTTVWAYSMDAVAAGLIFMVASSYLMWFRLKRKRVGGVIALALGIPACGACVGGWL